MAAVQSKMEPQKETENQLITRYAPVEGLLREAQAKGEHASIDALVQETRRQAEAAAKLDNVVELDNTICESCHRKQKEKQYRFGRYRSDICTSCVKRILGTHESQSHPILHVAAKAKRTRNRALVRFAKIEILVDKVDEKYTAILNTNADVWTCLSKSAEGRHDQARVWLEKNQPLTTEEMDALKAHVEQLHKDYKDTIKDNLDLVMEMDELRKINKRYSVVREVCDKNRELQQDKERLQKGIDRLKKDAEKRKAALEELKMTNEELTKRLSGEEKVLPAEEQNSNPLEAYAERLYNLTREFTAEAADLIIKTSEYNEKHNPATGNEAVVLTDKDKERLTSSIEREIMAALRILPEDLEDHSE